MSETEKLNALAQQLADVAENADAVGASLRVVQTEFIRLAKIVRHLCALVRSGAYDHQWESEWLNDELSGLHSECKDLIQSKEVADGN